MNRLGVGAHHGADEVGAQGEHGVGGGAREQVAAAEGEGAAHREQADDRRPGRRRSESRGPA